MRCEPFSSYFHGCHDVSLATSKLILCSPSIENVLHIPCIMNECGYVTLGGGQHIKCRRMILASNELLMCTGPDD